MYRTSVSFECGDAELNGLYRRAESRCLQNLRDFGGDRVLVEGGGYEKIWLETQPMGGEMYAKRDLEVGLNNVRLFMRYQREDGRMPGSIMLDGGRVVPQFNKFQGFCFPAPALNLYYLMGQDAEYLDELERALIAFDAYLWRTRNSLGTGLLESWCVCDTGEDQALRYGDAPFWWESEQPPAGYQNVPMVSMDVTSYSISARETLARIADIRGNRVSAQLWRQVAQDLRLRLRQGLWDEEVGACFDRLPSGEKSPVLAHNSLRCMYWGALSQDMADRFVLKHLLDPRGFWTPFPLPSVAASDPMFKNAPENNWSGQPEGLTYQRAIRALENYGYQPVVTALGRKLLDVLKQTDSFTQQFDPFTGAPSLPPGGQDAYGPTLLSALEYISRMHGVHIEGTEVWFGLVSGLECRYCQQWGEHSYTVESDGRKGAVTVDGKRACEAECGVRVVTDYQGRVLRTLPIEPTEGAMYV